jgi:hypothetical protein
VRQCLLQERRASAAPLSIRRDKKVGKKPQVAADPTKRETYDLAGVFCDPQAIPVVREREFRERRLTHGGHRREALAQLIHPGGYEFTGGL